MNNKITGYKAFDLNFCCDGMQFEVGKTYRHDGEIRMSEAGFQFYENPLDVFICASPDYCRFAVVEAGGEISKDSNQSYASELHIKAELSLRQLINACVKYNLDKNKTKAAVNSGNRSAAVNSGNRSTAVNSGNRSAAFNSGDRSTAVNIGEESVAISAGEYSTAKNHGLAAVAITVNHRSNAIAQGQESIAIAAGPESTAKGAFGCWLVLAEYDKSGRHRIDVALVRVDGEHIKANTYYQLKNGQIVEANQ